jgi:hypothetical protein
MVAARKMVTAAEDRGGRGKSARARARDWPGFAFRGGPDYARLSRPATASLPSTWPGSARNAPVAYAMATGTVPARTWTRSSKGTNACKIPQQQWR